MGAPKAKGRSFIDLLGCSSSREMDAVLRSGVPVSAVDELASWGVDAVGIGVLSARTLHVRRVGPGQLTLEEGDRLYRVGKLVLLATDLFDSKERANRWLCTSLSVLGGLTPLEAAMTTPGYLSVEELLVQFQVSLCA